MCYLVRQQRAGAAERDAATLPPSIDRLRARWGAAIAATFIGGLAVAALVGPVSTPPLVSAKQSAPLAPVAARSSAVPATPVIEQTSAPIDDGVPAASDVVKAGLGHCHHDM